MCINCELAAFIDFRNEKKQTNTPQLKESYKPLVPKSSSPNVTRPDSSISPS